MVESFYKDSKFQSSLQPRIIVLALTWAAKRSKGKAFAMQHYINFVAISGMLPNVIIFIFQLFAQSIFTFHQKIGCKLKNT
jgi:uncharacterized membrane protein